MRRLRVDESVRGSTSPWWVLDAPPDEVAPPLQGTIEADVAVIGGGLTGLWTARALQERGASAVVLEAATCGAGASARNGGFLHGYWSSLQRLKDAVGADAALETARAADGVIPAVRALGEDVWLEEGGLLFVSRRRLRTSHVDRAIALAAELGVARRGGAGRSVRPACAHRRFAPPCTTGTVRRCIPRGSSARCAAGCASTSGRRRSRSSDGCVRTPGGVVRAPEIVLATNAWAARWPAGRQLAVLRSAIVLTAPVPDLAERVGWEGGEGVFDGRTFLSYFRTTRDGRVLMGSAGGSVARAEAALRTLLPALADVPVEHAWEGPIDVSSDRLPFFGTVPGTRIHFGAGYTGNGVGPSWLGGQILASLATAGGRPVDEPAARRARAGRGFRPNRCAPSGRRSSPARCSRSTTRRRPAHSRASPRELSRRRLVCSGFQIASR